MIGGRRLAVVMPAYNAARTVERTWREVHDLGIVDDIVLVDDASRDDTVRIAEGLPGVRVERHPRNRGYGGNQKTCYRIALGLGADIIVMVHPDYQYTPKLIPAMAGLVASGIYPCVLGSRILGGRARAGGMPLWKYVSNRALTFVQNVLLGSKLSEFHTGYRAYDRALLAELPLERFSDDFVFDAELLAAVLWQGHPIGEISCPAAYFPEASSINFRRSVAYGLGCLRVAAAFRSARLGLGGPPWYAPARSSP